MPYLRREALRRGHAQQEHQQLPVGHLLRQGPLECEKMVVIYDEDGVGGVMGNQFVERGVENTYVVSGGFGRAPIARMYSSASLSSGTLAKLMSRAGLKGASGSGAGSLRSDAGPCVARLLGLCGRAFREASALAAAQAAAVARK